MWKMTISSVSRKESSWIIPKAELSEIINRSIFLQRHAKNVSKELKLIASGKEREGEAVTSQKIYELFGSCHRSTSLDSFIGRYSWDQHLWKKPEWRAGDPFPTSQLPQGHGKVEGRLGKHVFALFFYRSWKTVPSALWASFFKKMIPYHHIHASFGGASAHRNLPISPQNV